MITRREVAEYAGVSKTMVTRVINNQGYVAPEKRKRVEEAIRILGYQPNLIGRSLKTKQTKQIIYYVHDFTNPFFLELYQGMEDYARESGYTVIITQDFDPGAIRQWLYDGVILSVYMTLAEELLQHKIPVVVTNSKIGLQKIPSVSIDIENGAFQVIEYLGQCGHTRIGYINNLTAEDHPRLTGYLRGLTQLGITPESEWVIDVFGKGLAYEEGFQAALRLLENAPSLTAIFAYNDAMAIGAMAALHTKGLRIPQDISIVGFDDILVSNYTCPGLTTVKIPKYDQGRECIRLLMENKTESKLLYPELVVRESVCQRI